MNRSKTRQVQLINGHNAILASEADKEVFFETLMNPPKPNKALKEATIKYKNRRKII